MPYVEASVRSRQFVAAARRVMSRQGVASTALRAVAAEAEVPLGTLQYVFPSKELLLRAVIEDVIEEIATVLGDTVEINHGLAHAIRQGLTVFWAQLVTDQINLQMMQFELLNYALRQPGLEEMARWQYQRYAEVVARWCETAAVNAGEVSVDAGTDLPEELVKLRLGCVRLGQDRGARGAQGRLFEAQIV